jgi:hypothetical protein
MKKQSILKGMLAVLVLLVSISSCKKDEKDPAPDLATKVAGIYIFSELEFEGNTIPADKSNLKGDIRLVRKTATTVDAELDIRLKSTDEEFMVYDVSDIELVEQSGDIDLIYDGEKVAQIKGKKVIVSGTDDAGVDFKLTATR